MNQDHDEKPAVKKDALERIADSLELIAAKLVQSGNAQGMRAMLDFMERGGSAREPGAPPASNGQGMNLLDLMERGRSEREAERASRVTLKQAAKALGATPRTVRKHCNALGLNAESLTPKDYPAIQRSMEVAKARDVSQLGRKNKGQAAGKTAVVSKRTRK